MGQFVIKKVGDMAALECIFPPNHNNTQWILPDLFRDSKVSILTPFHALLTFLVTDVLHETTFLCQALTPKGNYVYKHYMLITYGNFVKYNIEILSYLNGIPSLISIVLHYPFILVYVMLSYVFYNYFFHF